MKPKGRNKLQDWGRRRVRGDPNAESKCGVLSSWRAGKSNAFAGIYLPVPPAFSASSKNALGRARNQKLTLGLSEHLHLQTLETDDKVHLFPFTHSVNSMARVKASCYCA
jgi:hypothetical protein